MPSIPCTRAIRFYDMPCPSCEVPHSVSAEEVRNDVIYQIKAYIRTTPPMNKAEGGAIAGYGPDIMLVYGGRMHAIVERMLAELVKHGWRYQDLSIVGVPPCDTDEAREEMTERAMAEGKTIEEVAFAPDPLMN